MDTENLKNLSPSKIQKMKAHEAKIAKYQSLEGSVLQTINEFLIAALTLVCRERKLTPNRRDIFKSVFKFGINVPVFANPQARLYIEGIARKATALIRQNALHACIFHVKEARLYCHQRFVFKVEGDWSLGESKTREPSTILQRLNDHCHNCLVKLLSIQSELKDLQYPTVSRWSISLGLREDFVSILQENNIFNPFQHDPDSHFPWKRTVKPMKSDKLAKPLDYPATEDNAVCHQPTPTVMVTNSDNISLPLDPEDNFATSKEGRSDANSHQSVVASNGDENNSPEEIVGNSFMQRNDENNQDDGIMMDLDEILDCESETNRNSDSLSFQTDSSFWMDEDGEEEEESVFLVPIYSFKILEGIAFNVYALDYSEIVEKQIKLLGPDLFLASTKGA